MKTKRMYVSVLTVLISFLFICTSNLFAQKFNNLDPVKYIQLPSQDTKYGIAYVYILEEQDKANKKLGGAFGKLTAKMGNDVVQKGIKAFAKEVLSNKQEKQDTWKLIPDNFSDGSGKGKLKVVIAYLPDHMAKPMGEPMKNNDGKHVFSYRVNTKMILYNNMGKLILERDFGAVSGIATSKTWPKNAGGSKAFGVSVFKGDKKEKKHPYEKACVEGAVEHVQRVVYGMYGVKEFEIPMHVMWTKSEKDTKDLAKEYKNILKDKKGVVLSAAEMGKMKSLVEKWETMLDKVDKDEKWTIHYDLAAGYSWLINPEKSKEHISKVKELNKDIFDKITNSSGNWGIKDLKTLKAYNSLHPFAEYYAAGIKANPDYNKVDAPKLPYFAPGVSLARSILISKHLGLPAPMPVYPIQLKTDVKKAEGVIKESGNELAIISYDYSKGKLEAVQVKGENKFDKVKQKYVFPDNSDNHPSHMHRFLEKFDASSYNGDVYRKGENEFAYYNPGEFKCDAAFPIFAITGVNQEYGFQNGELKVITEKGFYKEVSLSSKSAWGFKNVISKEEYQVDITSKDYKETFKVTEFDKKGYPSKVKVIYLVNNAWISVHANIKYKFGEETSKENSRQRSANKEVKPKAMELIMKAAKANGAIVKKGTDKDHFNFKMTKSYDVNVETNSKGMWTKIVIDDYELTREIK